MRDEFIATVHDATAHDDRLMIITGDLGYRVLDEYALAYPLSYVNAGVAEQSMTMLAAGCALTGKVVFTYSIANFPTLRCLEMLRNDVAFHDLAVIAVGIGGGFSYGALGMSHHATEDLAILRAIPGMTVVAPGDLFEVRAATEALIAAAGPAYLRIDKTWSTADVGSRDFQLGRARVCREGADLTVISTGGILGEVLAAADVLRARGHGLRVLSMHTVKPIDRDAILAAASETGGIVTVEEHVATGGLGSAVLEVLGDAQAWPSGFRRVALPADGWAPVGSQDYLRSDAGLDRASLEAVFKECL